jgi:hypothetical protein
MTGLSCVLLTQCGDLRTYAGELCARGHVVEERCHSHAAATVSRSDSLRWTTAVVIDAGCDAELLRSVRRAALFCAIG